MNCGTASVDDVRHNPIDRLADFVVDARLVVDRAAESRRRDAHEDPAASVVDDERAARIALRAVNNRGQTVKIGLERPCNQVDVILTRQASILPCS